MAGGPQSVIGLDIGMSTVKAVQVRQGKQHLELVGFGIMPTPPGTVDNHVVVDPPALGAALKQMLQTSGIRGKQVVSSVGGQTSLVVRITEVPKMESKELREAMQWDVERHIPFPASAVQMDFVPIDRPDADPNAPNMEILLAVAQDEMINSHVATLQAAGLEPIVIDVEPLAATRALVNVDEARFAHQTIVVVNIGDTTTDISIIRDGYLRFVRSIPMAGSNLTRAISQGFIVDMDEATRLKHAFGTVVEGARFAGTRASEEVGFAEQPRPEELVAGFGAIPGVPQEGAPPAAPEPAPAPAAAEPPVPQELGRIAFTLDEMAPGAAAEEPEAAAPPLQFDLGDDEEPVSMGLDIAPAAAAPAAPPAAPPAPPEPQLPPAEPAHEEPAPAVELGAWGAPPVHGAIDTSDDRHTREQISEVIVPVLGELATEIRRSLEFYRRQHRNENVDRLVLVGGTALVRGLAQFVANEVGITTEIGDPCAYLDASAVTARAAELKQLSPVMAISVGLAIRDMLAV